MLRIPLSYLRSLGDRTSVLHLDRSRSKSMLKMQKTNLAANFLLTGHLPSSCVRCCCWVVWVFCFFVSSCFYLPCLQLSHLNNFCAGFCNFAVSTQYVPDVPNRNCRDGDCLRGPSASPLGLRASGFVLHQRWPCSILKTAWGGCQVNWSLERFNAFPK